MPRPLVVALVSDAFHPFEVGVACEIFGIDRSALCPGWYRFALVGDRSARSSIGPVLTGLKPLTSVKRADTLIIPGYEGLDAPPPKALIRLLQAAANRGTRFISFCSGSFLLAHAGLLDGKRAATHWLFAERMAATFPRVQVESRPLWVNEGRIWTAAGTAAAIDCGLAVIAADFGQDVATQVARRVVASPVRSGGQAQFIERPLSLDDDRLETVRQFVREHLDEPLDVRRLARVAAMSERTFARHFCATAGITPHAWVIQQRIEHARRLLEQRRLSIDAVADRVGMEPGNLRKRFCQLVGVTPTAYRRAFAS